MNKSLIILILENLFLLIASILYLCRKSIFFCPKCKQRKSFEGWGIDIICSACEEREKAQCEVF